MLILHHTANDVTMENELKSVKRKRGASPYHYIIGKDGEIVHTREDFESPGATKNKEANKHGIQIALVGNFNNSTPTIAQTLSLRKLIKKYDLPIKLHREVGKTACPGKYFQY